MNKFIFLFLLTPSFVFASSSDSKKFPINNQDVGGFVLNIQGGVDFPIEILPHTERNITFTNTPKNSSVNCVVENKVITCSLSQIRERHDKNTSEVSGNGNIVVQDSRNSKIVIGDKNITQFHTGSGDNIGGNKASDRSINENSQDKVFKIKVPLHFKLKAVYEYPYSLPSLKITSNKEKPDYIFFQSLSLSIVRNPNTVNTRSIPPEGLGQIIVEEGFFVAIKVSDFFHSLKIQNYYPLCLYYITSLISKPVYLDFSKKSLLMNEDKIIANLSSIMTKNSTNTKLQDPEINIPQSELTMTFNNELVFNHEKQIILFCFDPNNSVTLIPTIHAKKIIINDNNDSLFL